MFLYGLDPSSQSNPVQSLTPLLPLRRMEIAWAWHTTTFFIFDFVSVFVYFPDIVN